MRRFLQVFEHGTLQVAGSALSQAEFDALVKFNQRHGSSYFTVGFKSLKFSSYVGVIQVGTLTIEILPKADQGSGGNTVKWRNALIDMLREGGYLKLSSVSRADLHLRRVSLFDLYMEAFLEEVRVLLHQGLVKKYRQTEGNVSALKGRLQFSHHLNKNLIHRERFYTVHSCFDRNNLFNGILKCGLQIVARVAHSPHLQRDAKGIIECFEDVPDRRVMPDTFSQLGYDRNTERYRYAITLARLIILNYQPDVRAGREDVLAILFDMNELFETYVFRQIRRAMKRCERSDIEVSGQCSKRFWRSAQGNRGLRPDILIKWGEGDHSSSTILDTKWKIPKARQPEDADLKQMYAYNHQFGSKYSYLLYPLTPGARNVDGWFESASLQKEPSHGCGMWFLELFKEDELRYDLGQEILERLLPQPMA